MQQGNRICLGFPHEAIAGVVGVCHCWVRGGGFGLELHLVVEWSPQEPSSEKFPLPIPVAVMLPKFES
jgi:hypothetical protein